MRLALLLLLPTLALAAPAQGDEKPTGDRPRTPLELEPIRVEGETKLPPKIVLSRSKHAKADLDSAADHLEDAARRR